MSKFSDWMRKKLCKEHKKYTHKNYGRIYPPLYNMYYPFTDRQPDVYNEFGEKLETFLLGIYIMLMTHTDAQDIFSLTGIILLLIHIFIPMKLCLKHIKV